MSGVYATRSLPRRCPVRARPLLCSASLSSALFALVLSCRGGEVLPEATTELGLARAPGGRIALEIRGAPRSVCAIQAEMSVEGSVAFVLEAPQPPVGAPLDTVRMKMRETNRAILFAGDKRGVLLPRSGEAATFLARSAGESSHGLLRIASAIVSDCEGRSIEARLGPSIAVE